MDTPEGSSVLRGFFVALVMTTPYVWLPAVMLLAAWAGHLVVFRALREPTPRARRRV